MPDDNPEPVRTPVQPQLGLDPGAQRGAGRKVDDDELGTGSEQEHLLRAARLLTGRRPAAENLLEVTLDWASRARPTLTASDTLVLQTRRRLVAAFLADAARAGDHPVAPSDSAPDTWIGNGRRSERAGDAAAERSGTRSTGRTPSLLAGLAALPAEHRAIVVARYYLALSIMEIVEVLDLDDKQVQRTAADVLQALQHKLEDGSWRLTDNWSWFRGQADAELTEAAQPDDSNHTAAANPQAEPDPRRRHVQAAIAATMLTLSLGLIGVAIGLGTTAGDTGPSLPARPTPANAELSSEAGLPAPAERLDIQTTPTAVPGTREKTSGVPVTRYPTRTVGSWPTAPASAAPPKLTTAQPSARPSTTASSTPNPAPTRPTGTGTTPPPSASPSPSPSPSTSPSPTDSDDD